MAKRICSHCGSRNTAPILWGMPAFGEKLAVKIANNDIFLGGCCVGINDPTFQAKAGDATASLPLQGRRKYQIPL